MESGPGRVKIEVLGSYALPDTKLPNAWFYRNYSKDEWETGAVNIHLQIGVDGRLIHYVLDVPARSAIERRYLADALLPFASKAKKPGPKSRRSK